jgi:hypothetical protein
MIPDEQPHFRLPLSRIQETAVEIVCRKLLGDRARSGPPLLHQRENAFPTEHMEPDRELLMGVVKSWFDNDLKHKDDINPGQLRRLEDALKIAQDDLHSIKRTKRSRASKNKRVARVAPNRASDPKA